jgi:hypothetical protein
VSELSIEYRERSEQKHANKVSELSIEYRERSEQNLE